MKTRTKYIYIRINKNEKRRKEVKSTGYGNKARALGDYLLTLYYVLVHQI
jgi:hypothetical protein